MNKPAEAYTKPELDEIEIENEILLSALHITQEKLEETTAELEASLKLVRKLSDTINRISSQFPHYWDAQSIQHDFVNTVSKSNKIKWVVTDTELAGRNYELIEFETTYRNGLTELKIKDSSKGFDFFSLYPSKNELNCSPVNGSYSAPENKLLSSIGTSDWKAIKELVKKLKNSLTTNQFSNIPSDVTKHIVSGLNTLGIILEKWPTVLRYDNLELFHTVNSSEYQSLGLKLINVEFSSKSLPSFSYHLSSVNEPGKSFGQFPRLEFYEDTKAHFEKWFCETADTRGNRLELRFAYPNQMDVGVWKKLSSNDQLLIAANISKLPETLKTLQSKGNKGLDFDAWVALSANLSKILSSALKY